MFLKHSLSALKKLSSGFSGSKSHSVEDFRQAVKEGLGNGFDAQSGVLAVLLTSEKNAERSGNFRKVSEIRTLDLAS